MKHNILLTALYFIFGLSFIFHVSSFVFQIYMNTVWDKTQEETDLLENRLNYTLRNLATIYKEDGFNVPVTMQFSIIDTIIQVGGILKGSVKQKESWIFENDHIDNRHWYNTWPGSHTQWRKSIIPGFDTIYMEDTLITRAIVDKHGSKYRNTWYGEKVEERFAQNVVDLVTLQRGGKTTVKIRTKTSSQFWFLLIRENLKTFFYLFLFYQLFQSIRALQSNFSFSPKFYGRIKFIGWSILIYFLLQYLSDYSLHYLYDYISIHTTSTAANYIRGLPAGFHADYSFPFEGVTSGLLLITFSILMKKSFEIEKNWSLTI